jgi:hypothetical protein
MTFRLHQAQYDDQTERAYVEFRRGDGDGGERVVVAVFSFDKVLSRRSLSHCFGRSAGPTLHSMRE